MLSWPIELLHESIDLKTTWNHQWNDLLMTERSPECWVCEAILLDWVVLGIRALEVLREAFLKSCEHCPHTNDTDLGTLRRFNTWNLAASSSRQLVLSVQCPETISICNAEARYPVRIASAMFSSNWEKQNAPFMFTMSVLSPTLGTRPQSFGGTNMENQYRGRTTSCCFRLASASSRSILQVSRQWHQKYAKRKFLQLISSMVVDPIGRPRQTAGASTDSHPQP